MSAGKYGRLFTEVDVEKMLRVQHDRSWSAALCDWDEHAPAPSAEEYRPLTVADAAGEADQVTGGLTFPADEPLFLLRGQDRYAPWGAQFYINGLATHLADVGAGEANVSREHFDAAHAAWQRMLLWQRANPDRVKAPD